MGLAKVLPFSRRKKRRDHEPASSQRSDAQSNRRRDKMRQLAKAIGRKARWYGHAESLEQRLDSWKNSITKLGVMGDKRLGAMFSTDRMVDLECEDLWRGSDMAATAVETVPDAIERAGFEVLIQELDRKGRSDRRVDSARVRVGARRVDLATDVLPPKDVEAKDETAKELAEAMEEQCGELDLLGCIAEALRYERAYGGAAILVGLRDGVKDLSIPLDLERIESVDWLDVLQPLELIPYQWYDDPYDAKYGQPELYWMQRIPVGNLGATQRVPIHESRLIRFTGIVVSRRQQREHWGWGDSVLLRMQEVLRDFDMSWSGAALLASDFAQMVISIKGLAESFATGDNDLLIERAKAMDEGRSIARAILIDAEEKAERQQTPVTGLADLLDRFCNRLAAAARTPVTLLMGQAPAGLNATGDSDVRNFFDRVASERERKLGSKVRQLFKMLFAARKGPANGRQPAKWGIAWGPMWQLTEKEEAERRKAVAEADKLYIDSGVLIPGEVAKARFGGVKYSADTQLDRDLRDAFDKEAEVEAQQQAKQLQAQLEAGQQNAPPAAAKKQPTTAPASSSAKG
jgi:phage-related protein (TIGR01555 family)